MVVKTIVVRKSVALKSVPVRPRKGALKEDKYMISILDLPVKPKDRDEAVATSVILDTFLKERNSVSNANEFSYFC